MVKISSYALSAAVLTHGVSRSAAMCGESGPISTFTGECNYANFMANLSLDCDVGMLFPPDIAEQEVDELCRYDAPVLFVEIQGTYQLDRRYFAGGGPLVDGSDYKVDSARVGRFDANLAGSTMIGFPEYLARVQYNADNGLGVNGYPANMNLETSCGLNTVMCCFADGDFLTQGDLATDVCRHDLSDSPESNHINDDPTSWSVFPGSEAPAHCVGFTWVDDDDQLLGNMMFDVSLRQTVLKGYKEGVPGAPMCGCIEHMPVVEEAACRTADGPVTYSFSYVADETGNYTVTASNVADITYSDCKAGDLKEQFVANGGDAEAIAGHLVGNGGCPADLVDYLNDEQFLAKGTSTRWLFPEPTLYELFVGEGAYFQPPAYDDAVADAEFRALIGAGCRWGDGSPRHCIVRRVCGSCISEAHIDIYYQRLTDLPPPGTNSAAGEVNFLDVFMNNWISKDNDMAAGDFALYSTYDDALAGTNAWTHCNYNYHQIGFPLDCGPEGHVWNNWNSYVRSGGYADHHGFYVEKP